jgi:hypothetical protein
LAIARAVSVFSPCAVQGSGDTNYRDVRFVVVRRRQLVP